MSERAKKFGSGAIISALFIFTLTGVFGWIGITTVEVPALKAQSQAEFKNLNKNLDRLTIAQTITNKAILVNSNKQDDRLNELTNVIYSLGIEVRILRKDCDENHFDIKTCEKTHKGE